MERNKAFRRSWESDGCWPTFANAVNFPGSFKVQHNNCTSFQTDFSNDLLYNGYGNIWEAQNDRTPFRYFQQDVDWTHHNGYWEDGWPHQNGYWEDSWPHQNGNWNACQSPRYGCKDGVWPHQNGARNDHWANIWPRQNGGCSSPQNDYIPSENTCLRQPDNDFLVGNHWQGNDINFKNDGSGDFRVQRDYWQPQDHYNFQTCHQDDFRPSHRYLKNCWNRQDDFRPLYYDYNFQHQGNDHLTDFPRGDHPRTNCQGRDYPAFELEAASCELELSVYAQTPRLEALRHLLGMPSKLGPTWVPEPPLIHGKYWFRSVRTNPWLPRPEETRHCQYGRTLRNSGSYRNDHLDLLLSRGVAHPKRSLRYVTMQRRDS